MTRENKLALVVGFALILFVGILISDHFSAARNQQSAELTRAADPIGESRWENPDLIALVARKADTTPIVRDEPAADPLPRRAANDPVADLGVNDVRPVEPEWRQVSSPEAPSSRTIEMGIGESARATSGIPQIGLAPDHAQSAAYSTHAVRKGETMTAICRKHYGDASLVSALAKFNGIENPDRVPAEHVLKIPDVATLAPGRTKKSDVKPADVKTNDAPKNDGKKSDAKDRAPLVYTVAENETLSEIASKLLGSAKKYHQIYENNRDLLKSPDDIQAGMKLKIPAQAE